MRDIQIIKYDWVGSNGFTINKENVLSLMRRLCDEYEIKFTQIITGDEYCKVNGEDSYINRSISTGHISCEKYGNNTRADIDIGIYQDEELKLISFFHELGHVTDDLKKHSRLTIYQIEKRAWEVGYELAKKERITFSVKAQVFARKCLETYNIPNCN